MLKDPYLGQHHVGFQHSVQQTLQEVITHNARLNLA